MKTSIATVSISGTLDAKLQAIAAAGYDGVEIFENDLLSTHFSARDISSMMADLGLACTMFQPFRDLDGLPEPQRTRAFDRLERKFDVMQELGTDLLLLCSSCSPIASADRAMTIADLHEAGERAAARGLRIGYEALAWGRHVNDHRDAWSIVRDVDHPSIGLVLDSFHSLSRRIPSSSIGDIRARAAQCDFEQCARREPLQSFRQLLNGRRALLLIGPDQPGKDREGRPIFLRHIDGRCGPQVQAAPAAGLEAKSAVPG